VEGRWQTGSFTNKEGQKIYTNDCIVNQVEFAESKKSESGSESSKDDSYMDIPEGIDEEIPFTKV
jgi:single-strand DNA-binding protein